MEITKLKQPVPIFKSQKTITHTFSRYPLAISAAFILFLIVMITILAPILSPYDPNHTDALNSIQLPSLLHRFGTDMDGRDVLSRLLYGGRTALLSPLAVVGITILVGIPLGLFSGYFGGKFDNIFMRICDIILIFPPMLLALLTVAVLGRGIRNSVIVLGIFYVPMMARMIRAKVIVQKEQCYIEACHALGYSNPHIIFRHLLPNCTSTIIVQSTLYLGYTMLDLAALSYLGLGVQPPTADWGTMLHDGRQILITQPWLAISTGVAVMLTVICFNLIGDGLESFFDPKRKKV